MDFYGTRGSNSIVMTADAFVNWGPLEKIASFLLPAPIVVIARTGENRVFRRRQAT